MKTTGVAEAVQLMRREDVPAAARGRTFRYSTTRASLGAFLLALGGAALLALGRLQRSPVAYFAGAVTFLVLWASRNMVLARFRPTNWLVRLGDTGLYINFRSYLNHHLPGHDPTVVFVPFREIRLARIVRELRYVPNSHDRGSTARRRTLVELELRDDAPEVAAALVAERRMRAPRVARWFGSSATLYRHYPVAMPSPRHVTIEWGVVPEAAELLRVLAAHVDVHALDVTKDYRHLEALSRDEQERRLLELAEAGQLTEAARIARSLYGYTLGQARELVEGLVRQDRLPRQDGSAATDR